MLPPPAASLAQSETIDWTAITDRATAVATAREIKQLFSDSDLPALDEALGGRGPTSRAVRAVDLSQLDRIPALVDRDALPNAPFQQNYAKANQSPASHRAATQYRSGRLRKAAMALMVVGLLAGGTMVTRTLGPSLAAAWDTGTLVVQTKPKGLQVFVDGIERGLNTCAAAGSSRRASSRGAWHQSAAAISGENCQRGGVLAVPGVRGHPAAGQPASRIRNATPECRCR